MPGLLLDIHQKDSKLAYYGNTCTCMFIAVLFTIVKTLNYYRHPSTDGCIKKVWYAYTMQFYLGVKKN